MPVVKTETCYLKQLNVPYPKNKFVKSYNFDRKTEVFNLTMPRAFTDLFPGYTVKGASIEAVDRAFSDALVKWDQVQTKVRKVILYRFAVRLWNEEGKTRDDFPGGGHSERAPKTSLGFEYELAMERVINGKAEYWKVADPDKFMHEEDFHWKVDIAVPYGKDRSRRDQADTQVVDWTPEREQFFADLHAGLTGIITKVMAFEGQIQDVEKLDQILLLGGGPKLLGS